MLLVFFSGMTFLPIVILILIFFVIFIMSIKVVPQAQTYIIERLGTYHRSWEAGIHFKVPFIDRISRKISLKENVVDFPPQDVITKDNVTMQIDTVIFYQVIDARLYTYGIDQPISAIEALSATTLRNLIGDLELDETLTSRDFINNELRTTLDEATDPWGIKVNRVELKNIIPPKQIQNAMERQMKAERIKREQILLAEGKKESQILEAEGEKEAQILRADAKKQSDILEAEGKAQAILDIQRAQALGLEKIKEVKADPGLVSLQALEALKVLADGRATKIIIPSDVQGLAGLAVSLQELVQTPSPETSYPEPPTPKSPSSEPPIKEKPEEKKEE